MQKTLSIYAPATYGACHSRMVTGSASRRPGATSRTWLSHLTADMPPFFKMVTSGSSIWGQALWPGRRRSVYRPFPACHSIESRIRQWIVGCIPSTQLMVACRKSGTTIEKHAYIHPSHLPGTPTASAWCSSATLVIVMDSIFWLPEMERQIC